MANLPTTDVAAPPMLGWRRLGFALLFAFLLSLPLSFPWTGSYALLLLRLLIAGVALLLVFGVLERWPSQLPRWLERWALQVVGVALAVPFAAILAYLLTSAGYQTSFWQDQQRLGGFGMILGSLFLIAPWAAMLGLLRQVSG